MPFSSTIVLPALELPVNCSIDLRTSSRSSGVANDLSYLMKPPADRPEPNILPLAWSVAMERPNVVPERMRQRGPAAAVVAHVQPVEPQSGILEDQFVR